MVYIKVDSCYITYNKQNAKEIICRHFSPTLKPLKPGVSYEHVLKLKDDTPFRVAPYPVPIKYQNEVRCEIEKMLKLGIIRPVCAVIKKDGSVRLCLDARKLNERLVNDNEAPVGIEEVLQKCRSIRVMSTIDLRSSYWQIPLREESKKYTAFSVFGKCYEFNVAAYGIKTSGAALIRGLEKVTQQISDNLLNFVDDYVCISKDFDLHLKHLRSLFQFFSDHNLTINFEKSFFAIGEVDFLGYKISPKGVSAQKKSLRLYRHIHGLKMQKN